MLGEESSKGKADDLAYYTSRKGSPLKTIISIDASHKIFHGKPLWKYKSGLKKKPKKPQQNKILTVNWSRKKTSEI